MDINIGWAFISDVRLANGRAFLPGGFPEIAWIDAGIKGWSHSALRNAVCLRTRSEFRRFS